MFKIKPAFKDYLWGGNKLKTEYGKVSELEIVAESWELSTHPAGESMIEIDGNELSLSSFIKEKGKLVLGSKCIAENQIPILIKLIDAKDRLSVQVHPDDAYAMAYENDLGKTEMWYVLEAEEGAQLVYGFKEGLTKEAFKNYIDTNTLSEVLNFVDVHKGDVFFITPGTMHAIGKGIVIAEIQQSSNVTYRVYDYGRLGTDGKARELHVEKAEEVTKLTKATASKVNYEMKEREGYSIGTLASCKYFTVNRLDIQGAIQLEADETSFHALLIVEGCLEVTNKDKMLIAKKGESIFIPAGSGQYEVKGKGQVILSTL